MLNYFVFFLFVDDLKVAFWFEEKRNITWNTEGSVKGLANTILYSTRTIPLMK